MSSVEKIQNTENETKDQILFDFSWWMKKQGYAEQTIEGRNSIMRMLLNRRVNIHDPESVKEYLASTENSNGRKRNIVHTVTCYFEFKQISWDPPQYKRVQKIPWIPQETLIDQLIASVPGKYKPFLQILKETGMRPGEAWLLKQNDLDYKTKQVRITPEKGSNPRILPISNELISMLNLTPQNTEWVFQKGKFKHFSEGYRRHRKRKSIELANPDINRIQLKTFRHFKGTMEYFKTKDILHVKYVLGHKNIKNTLIYTQLIKFKTDEYTTRITQDAEEASKLIESGFEYVLTTPDSQMIFKKRK